MKIYTLQLRSGKKLGILNDYCAHEDPYNGKLLYKYDDKVNDDKHHYSFLVAFDSLENCRIMKVDSVYYFSKEPNEDVTFFLSRTYTEETSLVNLKGPLAILLILCFILSIRNFVLYVIMHIFSDYKWILLDELRKRKKIDPFGEEDWDDEDAFPYD